MTAPLVAEWVERLNVAPFEEVGDYPAARDRWMSGTMLAPSAYVEIEAEEGERVTVHATYVVTVTMTVTIFVRSLGQGEHVGSYGLEQAKLAARTALVGWRPTGAVSPVEWVSGSSLPELDDLMAWQDVFTLQYQMTIGE